MPAAQAIPAREGTFTRPSVAALCGTERDPGVHLGQATLSSKCGPVFLDRAAHCASLLGKAGIMASEEGDQVRGLVAVLIHAVFVVVERIEVDVGLVLITHHEEGK